MSDYNFFYYKTIYLENCKKYNVKNLACIEYSSQLFGVNSELIFGIISLEKINRGGLFNLVSEKILINCFPNLIIKNDMSIGTGQLKFSTVKKILKTENNKEIIKVLGNNCLSIKTVALLISSIFEAEKGYQENIDKDIINKLASFYLTGSVNKIHILEVKIYADMLNWSYEKKLYEYAKKSR